jgi:hypothetical protein
MGPDPNATQTTPAPAPTPSPSPSTPPTPAVQSPASGPGSSGTAGSGTYNPTPAVPTPAPTPTPTPAAPVDPLASLSPELRTQFLAAQDRARQFDQYQHLIPLGYAAYQRQMQGGGNPTPAAPAPGQPQAKKNPFGLPDFDHNLLNFIRRDPEGRLVMDPGAPPDAAIRVQQYQEQLQKVQREFWSDPGRFLAPMIEERAQEVARRLYQEQNQQQTAQTFTQKVLQDNAQWLYEVNNGQPVMQFDPTTGQNRPVLSGAGRLYAQHVQAAHARGITDPQTQHEFAFAQVQNALYAARFQQLNAGTQQQQANQNFIAGQQPVTQPGPAPAPVPQPQPVAFNTLRDQMRARMDGNGITDAILAQQLSRAGSPA